MKERLEYNLLEGFTFASSGEEVKAETLTITAPANNVIRYVSVLDNALDKSLFAISQKMEGDKSKTETDKEIEANDIVMLLSGGDADINKCYSALENILPLTCFVNGSVPFTKHMFSKMSYKDTKNLLGEYLKFFLGTSLAG